MKNKNTKAYRELVEKYKSNKYMYELKKNDRINAEAKIAQYTDLLNSLNNGDEVDKKLLKDAIHSAICMQNVVLTFSHPEYYKDDMKKYGDALRNDYGVDLDTDLTEE